MNWTYLCSAGSKLIHSHDDLHPECTDIVYRLDFTDGTYYYGKKTVRSKRKYPPLKGKKRVRRKWKNIPFIDYEGSGEEIKNKTITRKLILSQCRSKKAATYREAELIFKANPFSRSDCINENILGKFFKKDLEGVISVFECLSEEHPYEKV